jgi:hypothetical protein
MFLRNVSWLLPEYKALYRRIQNSLIRDSSVYYLNNNYNSRDNMALQLRGNVNNTEISFDVRV